MSAEAGFFERVQLMHREGMGLLSLALLEVVSAAGEKGVRAGVVAERLGVSAATVTLTVNRLEERGLLQRGGRDFKDRRACWLMATDVGRAFMRGLMEVPKAAA